MKKTFFLLVIGLFSMTAQAQLPVSGGVHGRLAGYKFSQPSREYLTSFKPGFEFGAFGRIGLSKYFYFQPEFGFSYIGGSIDPEGYKNTDYKAAAINIPLLIGAKFMASAEAGFRFYVGLGNTIPILNSINVINDAVKDINSNYGASIPITSEASVYEISGMAGVGFDVGDFSIDLRYGRGFNPSVTIDRPNTGTSDKFYQNTYSLSVSYRIFKPKTGNL